MQKNVSNPLFASKGSEPLASRMRPRSLDEFVGQDHIVGPGRLLRRAIQKDQLTSIILSGPPGTGKTTLARIIANTTKSSFIALNAVLSGVADLRVAIDEARKHYELYSRKTILFVDEVHRWNKSQQDALLPWVENGMIILIGATTENPFFEVNRALVSRSRIFLLHELGENDLLAIAHSALEDKERGYGNYQVEFAPKALEHLIATADGDARSLLNALELAVETSVSAWPPEPGTRIQVSMEVAEESIQKRAVLYDKDGDYHYDAISAFIKSIRGSDPDAALYWLARMVYAGEDPSFIFRRMFISASEDIGLADPQAVQVVSACAQAFDRVGMPEGQYHLSEAALYLATCPKSNSTIGYFDALKAVEEEYAEVPDHLKDANRDAKGFGHGENYKYPHAFKDHWVTQQYLPETLRKSAFYFPGSLGLEGVRKPEVLARREAQLSLLASDIDGPEGNAPKGESIWSQEGDNRQKWLSRAEGAASRRLQLSRSALFEAAALKRDDSVLVFDPRKGFYTLEATRTATEGSVCCFLDDEDAVTQLAQLVADLPEIARPLAWVPDRSTGKGKPDALWLESAYGFGRFDKVILCEAFSTYVPSSDYWLYVRAALKETIASSGIVQVIFMEVLSEKSSRLSELLRLNSAKAGVGSETEAFLQKLEDFELVFGGGPSLGRARPTIDAGKAGESFRHLLSDCDIEAVPLLVEKQLGYDRWLSKDEVEAWISPQSGYGKSLAERMDKESVSRLRSLLMSLCGTIKWPLFIILGQASLSRAPVS
ncbi:MAG: AAA family ATPase [Spirochaetaceae bacterium]|nr:AAA family ATPase [Spirochaetaceae bacterium]